MDVYTLTNNDIILKVKSHGAEIISLTKNGREYMWNSDPQFWGRTAPILFPVVGAFKDNQYKYNGNTYKLGQHGFARDMEFTLISRTDKTLIFRLDADDKTLAVYPFKFSLEISYSLKSNGVEVKWKVINQDEDKMYFSIGGHPAFMCPVNEGEARSDYRLLIKREEKPLKELEATMLEGGLAGFIHNVYQLDKGMINTTMELFAEDALVLEDKQADEVSLVTPAGEVYLTVKFDMPLVGIWSPPGKEAPFVCIEPWCGRCDGVDFKGELQDREYGNELDAGECFETGFEILV